MTFDLGLSKLLLVIDIGNTNINFGVFSKERLLRKFFIPTQKYHIQLLKKKIFKFKIGDVVVCSVVPDVSKKLNGDIKKLLRKGPYNIGKEIKVPIRNLYGNPKQVGSDRLVNAWAGAEIYGAPLIAIDFGTAVTFDVVSRRREYLGGMILPGLKISLEALNQRTALLPKIKLGKPAEFIGRDTRNSMLSGIVYGFASLVDDLIIRIKSRIGRVAVVLATGGDIKLIRKYCRRIKHVDKELTLRGLMMLYKKQKNS